MKYWLTLVRATWALALGVALVIRPDATRPMFANFLGVFWILTGVSALLARNVEEVRFRSLSSVAMVIGIVAGVFVVLRAIVASTTLVMFRSDRSLDTVAIALGVVIILTGFLHLVTGFDSWRHGRPVISTSFIFGIFEIVLGGCLVITPQEYGPVLHWTATAWAIFGGIALFIESLRLRAAKKIAS